MKDNDLINDLVNDHKEIQKSPSSTKLMVAWFFICLLCLAAGVSFLGLREDWEILIKTPTLLLQNIFIFIGVIISGFFSIKLSTPGEIKQENTIYVAQLWKNTTYQ